MLKTSIYFFCLFGLTACVDYLEDEKPKNTEQQLLNEILTDGVWHKSFMIPDAITNPYSISIRSFTLSFKANGTFTRTDDIQTIGMPELPEFADASDMGPVITPFQYALGHSIVTESGVRAMNFDFNLDGGERVLDIVHIDGAYLYFGLPRKLPSCEGLEEPYYEQYDLIISDEPGDISDVSELGGTIIGHTLNCYGRPTTLDFSNPYHHLDMMILELEPSEGCVNAESVPELSIGLEYKLDDIHQIDQDPDLSQLNNVPVCLGLPAVIN